MKLGPVTKLGTKNKTTSTKFQNDIMSASCDVIVIFPIYGQFGATRKPGVCKTYIVCVKSHLLSKGTIFAKNL